MIRRLKAWRRRRKQDGPYPLALDTTLVYFRDDGSVSVVKGED